MNDRTITRASRQGVRTIPVERPARKRISSDIKLTPEEIAVAMELARSDRAEQEIRDYAHRKRTA